MKKVKLAMLRKYNEEPCPFGLKITFGCHNAGEIIYKMAPVDTIPGTTPEEQQEIIQANEFLLNWYSEGTKCPYADKILDEHQAVACTFAAPEEGEGSSALVGSPYYAKHFSGVGMDGLYSYPLGYYSDNSVDRGSFEGSYSIESIAEHKHPVKK